MPILGGYMIKLYFTVKTIRLIIGLAILLAYIVYQLWERFRRW